jgi:putative DNA primase/helicase
MRPRILSSGETSSAARLDEDRYQKGGRSRDLRGGATVRFIDIPADREFGAFDKPAGEPDFNPAAFAERMQEMASLYYGTAGPAFVKTLLDEKIDAADVRQAISDFILSVLADAANDEGQLRRGARRFGLVAAAGLMAISAGIVDWEPDAFVEGVRGLFRSWAKARGDGGSIEEAQILAIARSYFSRYGESRFDEVEPPDLGRERPVGDRAGYRTGRGEARRWYVFPQVWKDIFAGFNPHKAAVVLHRNGVVEAGNEAGRFDKKVRLGDGLGRLRMFVVTFRVVEGAGEPDTEEAGT